MNLQQRFLNQLNFLKYTKFTIHKTSTLGEKNMPPSMKGARGSLSCWNTRWTSTRAELQRFLPRWMVAIMNACLGRWQRGWTCGGALLSSWTWNQSGISHLSSVFRVKFWEVKSTPPPPSPPTHWTFFKSNEIWIKKCFDETYSGKIWNESDLMWMTPNNSTQLWFSFLSFLSQLIFSFSLFSSQFMFKYAMMNM